MAESDITALDSVIDQIQDHAIITLDQDGIILSWNVGAERVKGWTAAEAIGQNFEMFYSPQDRAAHLPQRLLEEARLTGSARHTGWRMRRDGTRFWAEVSITALHDNQGRLTGYAKVTRDRTDVKALEDAQDAFYAAFDHDFRTPLTALKGFAEVIPDADQETRERLVERITSSADHLLGMVEALMRFATRRGPDIPLTLDGVDLVALGHSVAQDLSPGLNPQRVRVAEGSAPAQANWHAMYRVVTNLLVNALKYSPQDSAVVLDFERTDDRIRLTVSDHGRGIAEEDLERIFEPFERGRLAQNDGGTGLGLTSVRELVRQQHGALWLESEVGVGTSVTVELPAAPERSVPQSDTAGHSGG